MSEEAPKSNDIQLIFKKLRAIPTNKSCFDCNAKLPTWSSITYGVFICIDCSAVHRSLGVHLTFVRSTQLDTNWTWIQLRQMQLGGNANADSFFRQHNCVTTDAQQKYNSRAAQLYREKLHSAAVQAMRLHGTKLEMSARESASVLGPRMLHLEPSNENTATTKKEEVDFFEELSITEIQYNDNQELDSWTPNGNISLSNKIASPTAGPNVEAALGPPAEPSGERKPTIGGRKPPAKKTGMGSKKLGGLGAQRVKADFAEIEREAELADQLKLQERTPAVPDKSPEEQEAQLTSIRLAYQDISLQQKREEEKLKSVDPKKAKQVERLGMGFASRSGVSHSAFSDMKQIEQETPVKTSKPSSKYARDDDSGADEFFDFFTSSSSSGFSMYKGNRTPTESSNESVLFESSKPDNLREVSGWLAGETTNRNASSKSSPASGWAETSDGGGGWGEPKRSGGWRESDWGEERKTAGSRVKESEESERKQQSTRASEKTTPSPASTSNEAQKKFGSAKAISSDQYFGDSSDTSWERKTNLSRFEGSSSISSADYFNRAEVTPGAGYNMQTPDLDDVKESVRQGVTKVAGKLSSLANGVMSSIQEKYGGY